MLKRLVDLLLDIYDEIETLVGFVFVSNVELVENFAKWGLLKTLEFERREPF